MTGNQFLLLKDRRFLPLFVTQFLGAFHDNLFRNALVVMLLFTSAMQTDMDPRVLATLAAGLFILPFALFSAIAGELSDKYPKHLVIRAVKLAEIAIALLGMTSLLSGSVTLAFATLFALGAQSAFFGPGKYSILPLHLERSELIGGNALLNTGTFLAILAGTIAGTTLAVFAWGPQLAGFTMLALALAGYVASRKIPQTTAAVPELRIGYNIPLKTLEIIRYAMKQPRGVFLAISGIAWFYFMGGMFMAQMPNYTRETLGANEQVLTLFLIIFSIGIGIGGLLNNRLLKGRVEAVYVPLAALGITVFALDLFFANGHVVRVADMRIIAFLGTLSHWRIMFDIGMIAISGGLFVVPLNAIVQDATPIRHRARTLAASAVMNALFIAASSVISAVLITLGMDIRTLFLVFAIANGFVAIYICNLLPDYLLKSLLQGLFKLLYKVEVRGLENLDKVGNRAVIVSNHVSLLDPPLLAAFLPGRPVFAISSSVAGWWWVRPFLKVVEAFPLDPVNPFSMKGLIRKVQEDRHAIIFPEGRLTETGALMKVYDGPGMVADKAGALILPVRLDGVQHTPFARLKGKVPLKSFPKITITILEPREFRVAPELKGRLRRAAAGRQLYDLMEDMMFITGDREQTLFQALLKARYVNGDNSVIAEDIERRPLRFKKLLQGSMVLGGKIAALTGKGEVTGLMLPNSLGAVVTFFAMQAYGRVPAMLNFSAGSGSMISACETAGVKTVLTSRQFIEKARLDQAIREMSAHVKIVYLEDLKKRITLLDKLKVVFTPPEAFYRKRRIDPGAAAVVLFTSGSEGKPKGVVLSHINLMTNIVQLSSRVDFNRQDIVFNCLPMFHSFGLTGGTLLPVLSGVKTFLYPSPLHYRIVPEMVYHANATIMFGTDTFLRGYAKMANPYDFFRMRYIFAGAEKVKDETRQTYMQKFGVQVLEGYGATETAPVIAVNSAMHIKAGTVGRFLPGIEYRLESVPGVEEAGRLYVRGANVMLGYYLAEAPGVLKPPEEGWHDTGDIVRVDDEGYVRIVGRAKRFAKIAGEMVSLAQSESLAEALWPQGSHAVVAIPDDRKGEQLVLVTTSPEAAREALSAHASQSGVSALAVPARIMHVETMPVLGSGKVDHPAVRTMVEG